LVVVDTDMRIKVVNPSFCTMFRCREVDILGQDAGSLLCDMADFREAWEEQGHHGKRAGLSQYDLYVREVIFPSERKASSAVSWSISPTIGTAAGAASTEAADAGKGEPVSTSR
jgi:PAS domain-containing protein